MRGAREAGPDAGEVVPDEGREGGRKPPPRGRAVRLEPAQEDEPVLAPAARLPPHVDAVAVALVHLRAPARVGSSHHFSKDDPLLWLTCPTCGP